MVTTRPPKTIVKPTALGPVANTDTKLLIYGLFQKGRVLAQDGIDTEPGLISTRQIRRSRGAAGALSLLPYCQVEVFRADPTPRCWQRRALKPVLSQNTNELEICVPGRFGLEVAGCYHREAA